MTSAISFSYPAYPCNPANPGSDKVEYGNLHYNGCPEVGAKNWTHLAYTFRLNILLKYGTLKLTWSM